MVDVSIIIVNYKTSNLVIQCIDSIKKHTESINYEIIVVDNNSEDGIYDILSNVHPDVKIILNPINAGFGSANNLGSKLATGNYLFLLNSDTIILDNCLKIFFSFMEKNKNIGASGGLLCYEDMSDQGSYGNFPSYKGMLFRVTCMDRVLKKYHNEKLSINKIYSKDYVDEVDYILGADVFIRRDIFEKLNGFDENFFLNFEETDLFFRFNKCGYKAVILPTVKIVHLVSKSFSNNFHKMQNMLISQFYYFRKNNNRKYLLFLIKALYMLKWFIRYLMTFNKYYLQLIDVLFKKC